MTGVEMVGWHHRLDGREFEQTPELVHVSINLLLFLSGFRGGSAGKESVCNAGDQGSIPG